MRVLAEAHRAAISVGRRMSADSVSARADYACLYRVSCDHGDAGLWSPFREAALSRLLFKVRSQYDPDGPERAAIDRALRDGAPGRLDALRHFLKRNPQWLTEQIAAAQNKAPPPLGE